MRSPGRERAQSSAPRRVVGVDATTKHARHALMGVVDMNSVVVVVVVVRGHRQRRWEPRPRLAWDIRAVQMRHHARRLADGGGVVVASQHVSRGNARVQCLSDCGEGVCDDDVGAAPRIRSISRERRAKRAYNARERHWKRRRASDVGERGNHRTELFARRVLELQARDDRRDDKAMKFRAPERSASRA